jgi:hypothetical protein
MPDHDRRVLVAFGSRGMTTIANYRSGGWESYAAGGQLSVTHWAEITPPNAPPLAYGLRSTR